MMTHVCVLTHFNGQLVAQHSQRVELFPDVEDIINLTADVN